jgi:hypothetical protein
MLVHLKVDDETFVRSMFEMLKPGGLAIVYNICPALSKPDEPFKPWSDGRFPFERDLLEKIGFEIIRFDEDDTEFIREMAVPLGWNEPGVVDENLFAHYTLLRKPAL